ncbi:MAG: response regulator transcription factor [Chloroflexi bacterium]|nr:response regulator transcription factor [Chloroflexota bacterium]
MGQLIRVVVIDDHVVSRKGIISLIESNSMIKVVAEGSAGNHVLELLKQHQPDVLITDLQMPAHEDDAKGILFEPVATLQRAIRQYPKTSVVVLTQEDDIQTIQSLAEVGVKGYMLKTDNFAEILDKAVEMIHIGGSYFSPEVKEVIFSAPKLTKNRQLTQRQLDVIRAIVRSPEATRAELADSLYIATSTLQKHITAIFEALNVSNMEACIIKAMRMRLVELDDSQV